MGEGQSKQQAADAARAQRELKEAKRMLREQAAESERKHMAEVEKKKAVEEKKKEEALLDEPWRVNKKNGWNNEEVSAMQEKVAGFVITEKSGIEHFNVLLLGTPTSGKTSLLNTVGSAFVDKILQLAFAAYSDPESSVKSATKMLKSYSIKANTEGTKMDLGIKLWDTMGLHDGLHTKAVCKIIDGKVPNETNLEKNLEDAATRPESEIENKHKMHCILFVVNATKLDALGNELLERIMEVTAEAEKRGLPSLLVLTHVDKICQHVSKDTNTVFKSPRIRDLVEKNAPAATSFPAYKIYPIRNYTKEGINDTAIDFLALLLMTRVIEACDDYCEYLVDRRQNY